MEKWGFLRFKPLWAVQKMLNFAKEVAREKGGAGNLFYGS
jgi:hypothetical protein